MKSKNLCAIDADHTYVFPDDEKPMFFDPYTDLGLLLVFAGVFSSVKDAWAAGFSDVVETGWSDFVVNGTRVCIYNPDPDFFDYDDDIALDPGNPAFKH